jgi:hypothetical protein
MIYNAEQRPSVERDPTKLEIDNTTYKWREGGARSSVVG